MPELLPAGMGRSLVTIGQEYGRWSRVLEHIAVRLEVLVEEHWWGEW